jgi:hypothetical protein
LSAEKSPIRLERLVLGSGPSDIVINLIFKRESVVQVAAAHEGRDINLTLSTVLAVELLCAEWSVIPN